MSFFSNWFKDPNQKVIESFQPTVAAINALAEEFKSKTDEQLGQMTEQLKSELQSGKALDDILVPAFAAIREANRRTINIFHFDVQLIGGLVLHRGEIAEMKTGEGKTHVAALPLYLNALEGKGAHLITVNDYLAKLHAGYNGKPNHLLGLKTSCLTNQQSFIYDPDYTDEREHDERTQHMRPCPRQEAYAADITYGTNSEFGFDYLRDNMVGSLDQQVQRDTHFAIIDEVDSILIDEARTPLIISAPAEESAALYQQFATMVPRLKESVDYNIDEKMRTATLTDQGIETVEKMLGMGNIYNEGGIQFVHHLEQALRAQTLFKLDKDYVVNNGEVIIIDEFTGRLMTGRRYSEGLHQAIEAKEGVVVNKESRTLATITIQNYFRLYKKLSGMTGTAATEAEEFSKIYNLDVTVIPTNQPVVRTDLTDKIYSTERGKFKAVVQEIKTLHEKGQPVLVGTIAIERNEFLSRLLTEEGVPHQVLNAKQHAQEAKIISQAGRAGAVTVATNMAGRGVDIILGGSPFNQEEYDKVKALGGLFVLGTERHEARRIDNQLRGRAGRQGDPGSSQFHISMEDDLARVFANDRAKKMLLMLKVPEDQPIEHRLISGAIEKAQIGVEGYHFDTRKHLVEYDDVMNKQRETIYKQRKAILESAKLDQDKSKTTVLDMVENEIEQVVLFHTSEEDQTAWNLKEIAEVVKTIFPCSQEFCSQLTSLEKIAGDRQADAAARTAIIDFINQEAKSRYERLEEEITAQAGGEKVMRTIEREVLIRSIDNLWVDHLDEVAMLRAGIGLRGYAQRDPLIEYKRETYQMFLQLQNLIQRQVVYSIYKVGLATDMRRSVMQTDKAQLSDIKSPGQFKDPFASATKGQPVQALDQKAKNDEGDKVGRNDLCPCGSGKKYKKCCG